MRKHRSSACGKPYLCCQGLYSHQIVCTKAEHVACMRHEPDRRMRLGHSSTCLPVNEALPQRPAPAAQVAHALPGQEGRPGEEALQVPVRQPELRPHTLPHSLLACMHQRGQARCSTSLSMMHTVAHAWISTLQWPANTKTLTLTGMPYDMHPIHGSTSEITSVQDSMQCNHDAAACSHCAQCSKVEQWCNTKDA